MTDAVAIEQCSVTWGATGKPEHRCALVAGHGVANAGHLLNGTVVDGHLYALYGEDLSPEIRTQRLLDELESLRGPRE